MTRSPSAPPTSAATEPVAPAAPRSRRRRRARVLHVTGRFVVPTEIAAWERELLLPLVTQILGDIERERP